jgi:hypothetical protein
MGRFGRVCHWSCVIVGGALGLAITAAFMDWAHAWPAFPAVFAPFAMIGRGLRYVFAGE